LQCPTAKHQAVNPCWLPTKSTEYLERQTKIPHLVQSNHKIGYVISPTLSLWAAICQARIIFPWIVGVILCKFVNDLSGQSLLDKAFNSVNT